MAPRSVAPSTVAAEKTFEQVSGWFWRFLKNELAPYPGRAWLVARMIISATIVMFLVMTFRLPNGFFAAIYTFNLSRESPAATLRSGVRIAIAGAAATTYSILTAAMMVDDPLTHYLWVMASLFLSFYALRLIPDYGTALAFSFPAAVAIPFWDLNTVNINTRVSNTLWLGYLMIIGAAVTVAVEFVFHRVHPATILTEGIDSRLSAVEELLRDIAADLPVTPELDKAIAQSSGLGTSRLRRTLLRSGRSMHFISQMNASVSLVGRLVDLAAGMRIACAGPPAPLTAEDRSRCLRLADSIDGLRRCFLAGQPLPQIGLFVPGQPSNLAFLAEMEKTAALIPQAFSGSASTSDFFERAPMDEDLPQSLFAPDGFSNPGNLQFAVRGSLAAMACYVTYSAIDWPGLQISSILTCVVTAVSTIGSSRQRQILRLSGVAIGGVIFGMGAQVFVLPHIDSIVGFTVLFTLVTAIAAWIATATPRISYLGLQIAVGFYLVNLQEFTIQTSLAVARDRVCGTLLALISMWLIFDRLWVRNALDEMQSVFERNLHLFIELTRQLRRPDRDKAIRRIRQLREQINNGFAVVRAQSDAILFEFGPMRQRKLEIREDMRRWDPSLRTLLQVQLTFSHYRLQRPLQNLPPAVAEAEIAFNDDIAHTIEAMADEVSGKVPGSAPDLRGSAVRVEEAIRRYYADNRLPLPPREADVISLIRNLTFILAPLYSDISIVFASNRHAVIDSRVQSRLGVAGSPE